MRLLNKVAIVTGGGSGYGEGIAIRFAAEGANVIVVDLDNDGAARVCKAINACPKEGRAKGGRALSFIADVSDNDAVLASVEFAVEQFGAVDIVVNNAGISHQPKSVMKITDKEFDAVMAVNTKSILLYARHAVPKMLDAGNGGALVTIASTGALRPRPGMTVYNASKAAAVALSKTISLELARHQIRVNTICPVAGDTPMLDKFMTGDPAANRAALQASIPMNRLATPADIGAAALFFASDDAAFVTGVTMEVDGGRCV